MLTNLMPENAVFFECLTCDFKCCKKSNYSKHLLTLKHKMLTTTDTENAVKSSHLFQCECGKEYKHRQSLSVHKKTCQKKSEENIENSKNSNNLEGNLRSSNGLILPG